jgi:hypothetical protein
MARSQLHQLNTAGHTGCACHGRKDLANDRRLLHNRVQWQERIRPERPRAETEPLKTQLSLFSYNAQIRMFCSQHWPTAPSVEAARNRQGGCG